MQTPNPPEVTMEYTQVNDVSVVNLQEKVVPATTTVIVNEPMMPSQ
jgi:hypothetical protein